MRWGGTFGCRPSALAGFAHGWFAQAATWAQRGDRDTRRGPKQATAPGVRSSTTPVVAQVACTPARARPTQGAPMPRNLIGILIVIILVIVIIQLL